MKDYNLDEIIADVLKSQEENEVPPLDPKKLEALQNMVAPPPKKQASKKKFWYWVAAPVCLVLACVISLAVVLNLPKEDEKRYSDVLNCEAVRVETQAEAEALLPSELSFLPTVFEDCLYLNSRAFQYENSTKALEISYEEDALIPPFIQIELVVTFTKQFVYSDDGIFKENLIENNTNYNVYQCDYVENSKDCILMLVSTKNNDFYFTFYTTDEAIAEKYLQRMKNYL